MREDRTSAGRMDLIVLGAGPAYSDQPGSLGSCYLVVDGDDGIVLDLGQGAFPDLAHTIEPSRLSAVVVSHLHPDHFIDLIPLRHYLCRMEFQPSRRLRVVAPAGLERRLDMTYDEPGFSAAAFDFEPLAAGRLTIGPFEVWVRPVRHAGESFAFRLSADGPEQPGLVYSGDCAEAGDLRPLIRPGDVLLCEATFGPGPVPSGMPHLDGAAAGGLAATTGARQLLLTHLRMGCDPDRTLAAARTQYRGPVSLIRPGDRIVV